jgi:hypothetical protein
VLAGAGWEECWSDCEEAEVVGGAAWLLGTTRNRLRATAFVLISTPRSFQVMLFLGKSIYGFFLKRFDVCKVGFLKF